MPADTLPIVVEAESLSPTYVVPMYVIDARTIGGGIFRFCPHSLPDGSDVVWKGNVYARYPMDTDGWEVGTSGQLPRPKVTFSNVFGTFTALNRGYADLTRALFIRKRTFYKNLDHLSTANPNAYYPDDVFSFNRKISENKNAVQYELISGIEIDGPQIPARQVFSNLCAWKYRSPECSYTGDPVANRNGDSPTFPATTARGVWSPTATYNRGHFVTIPLEDGRNRFYISQKDGVVGVTTEPPNETYWFEDECSKRVSDGCKKRFGSTAVLPFGGFPGSLKLDSGS